MANKVFQKNDQLYAVISYTNKLTGILGDPTSVTVKLKTPAGVTTTYTYGVDAELTRTAVGVYQFLKKLTETGTYSIRSEGDGVLIGSIEMSFVVDTTAF